MFFDTLGITWEYEPEGFELPSGRYLPDFWLPQVKMWAEVKAKSLTPEELTLCLQLAVKGHPVLMLDGSPAMRCYLAFEDAVFNHGVWDVESWWFDLGEGHQYWKHEGRFYREYFGPTIEAGCDYEKPEIATLILDQPSYGNDQAAVDAARSARFEHGETG